MGVDNFKINPSIYGMTKYFCEQLSHTYIETKNMNIAICKISNVFGPYSAHKSSVVHSFIKKILSNKSLEIHKDGFQERDFIYSNDVCRILYDNLKHNKKKVIQIQKYLRIIDIKNLLDKISNKKNKLDFVPTPEGYDDKVYKKPIIKADKNFINKLKTTFNWYKDTRKNWDYSINMKVLILGGDGYLGWPTTMHFANEGHDVYAIDNLSKRKIELSMELSL